MQKLEIFNLKCATYAQPISLHLTHFQKSEILLDQ